MMRPASPIRAVLAQSVARWGLRHLLIEAAVVLGSFAALFVALGLIVAVQP